LVGDTGRVSRGCGPALEWCGGNTSGESFVCLDDRLRGAAALEGFRVLPYSEGVNEAKVEYAVL
jgi:hypothetical protein